MELIGNLKKQVEAAKDKQEAKSIIEQAGMLLTDDELESISGGKENLAARAKVTGNNPVAGEPIIMPWV